MALVIPHLFSFFFLRYRSTATLVFLILVAGRRSPHKMLDVFVKTLASFAPTDGHMWSALEPALDYFDMKKLKQWNFERLSVWSFLSFELFNDIQSLQISHKLKHYAMSSMTRFSMDITP